MPHRYGQLLEKISPEEVTCEGLTNYQQPLALALDEFRYEQEKNLEIGTGSGRLHQVVGAHESEGLYRNLKCNLTGIFSYVLAS